MLRLQNDFHGSFKGLIFDTYLVEKLWIEECFVTWLVSTSASDDDADSGDEHDDEDDPESESEAEQSSSLSDSEDDSWSWSMGSSLGRLLSSSVVRL